MADLRHQSVEGQKAWDREKYTSLPAPESQARAFVQGALEDSEEAWFASEASLNAAIGNQSATRPPRILPDHLLKFTKRQLIGRALASAFLGLLGWAFLNIGLPGHNLSPLLVWTCIIIVFAIFRNLILTRLYCGVRVGFGVHYKLRSGVAFASLLFGGFAGLMIGAVWFSSIPADPKITATILGIGFLTVATGFPIPPILSDRGEASLLFAQSAFEVKARKDLTQGLRWSDRGVYVLRRVLKQYDVDSPTYAAIGHETVLSREEGGKDP